MDRPEPAAAGDKEQKKEKTDKKGKKAQGVEAKTKT
jgi:hypothetical protein